MLWSLIRILRASLVQIDTEMAEKYAKRYHKTLIFDLLTLKLVCESDLKWGTFLPNVGTLGLWVLELFAMYATDGQKQRLLPPSIRSGEHNKH